MRWWPMLIGGTLLGLLSNGCEADILRIATPLLGGPLDPVLFLVAPLLT